MRDRDVIRQDGGPIPVVLGGKLFNISKSDSAGKDVSK